MGLSDRAIEWIEARGIDAEAAVNLGLETFANNNGGEEIAIPFIVKGEVVNHKYRSISEKRFRQDKGATKCFWNFDVITDASLSSHPLVITEGEFDALAAIQCGYPRAVSVPDGAPSEELGSTEDTRKYTYLDHAKSALKDVREIIIATDSDGPGQNLLNDLSIRLGKARCKWVKYPKGCKDLNDTLKAYGKKGVDAVFSRAQWCEVKGVYKMSELPPYPDRDGYSTGIEGMDEHYNIRMGDFCVVTGIPGHGKSTFINDVICRCADRYGWRIAVASFEQHPQADHRRALREWCAAKRERMMSADELQRADRWIDEHFVFIVPGDDDLPNLAWCLEMCATAVVRHGVRVVIIDPWNELDHDRPPDLSLTEYTGKAIKEFKRFARQFDVHLIIVAHPTKLTNGERPTLYSISDSSHWANKADVGIVVHRPDITQPLTEVRVIKSRYHDKIGRPGCECYGYLPDERRYEYMPASSIAA
jgi:twinkle protein